MIGIVIVAHGGLAQEYLAAVQHVIGPQAGMVAIGIDAEHDRAGKQSEICAAAAGVDTGDGVAIVTDLYGSSSANLSFMACAGQNRTVLAGANLPMLVKLVKSRRLGLELAVEAAKEAGRKYINSFALSSPAPSEPSK